MKNKILTIIFVTVFSINYVNKPVQAQIADSPKSAVVKIWEPCTWITTLPDGDCVAKRITDTITGDDKNQGYQINRYKDDALNDFDLKDCTRTNWDNMGNCGIFVIASYSDDIDKKLCAAFTKFDFSDKTLEYWEGNEHNNGMTVVIDQFLTQASARVDAPTMGTFQSTLVSKNALVLLMFCHSGAYIQEEDEIKSPLYYCYGKIGFGYKTGTIVLNTLNDIYKLFDYMNGTNGCEYREAYQAFEYGQDYSPEFSSYAMNENEFYGLTLCPTIYRTELYPNFRVENPIAEGSGAGSEGLGFVFFDTRMDTQIPPDQVLTYSGITLSNLGWYENFGIGFYYSCSCCQPGYTANITIHADKARDMGGKYLDGGTRTSHGVAPNGHDYTFSFSY